MDLLIGFVGCSLQSRLRVCMNWTCAACAEGAIVLWSVSEKLSVKKNGGMQYDNVPPLKTRLWLASAIIVMILEMLPRPPRWAAVVEKELEGRN